MNVYIGEPVVISDMQGPAQAGFHIPLSSEWQAVYNAGVSLGAWSSSNGTNLSTYLKLPMAGYRSYDSLNFNNRGSRGRYWSSSAYDTDKVYFLDFLASNVQPQSYVGRSLGFSVRCVKNSPTIPTSSWTVLYQGTGNAGIYHNATDGLISISSDGSTWYTLMDKNLGATTVYNYGDALSEANCGKIYQWGNNYGFSGDANYDVSQISKSSTQVNVTGYGPGNYYKSSTWITELPRQSSANNGNNLRGGVSQGSTTKNAELKNDYIGEVYEYSYTFKGKTVAEIGNEWTVLNGSIVTNSNGFTGPNNNDARIVKYIPSLANAKRIIISGTIVGQNLSTTAAEIGIGKGTGWGTGNTSYQVFGSSYTGMKTYLMYNNTNIYGNSVGNATAQTYKPTLTIDLVNKTIVGSMSGFSNSTMSLSDAQVADIRTYEYIISYVSLDRSTISDISIIIEY